MPWWRLGETVYSAVLNTPIVKRFSAKLGSGIIGIAARGLGKPAFASFGSAQRPENTMPRPMLAPLEIVSIQLTVIGKFSLALLSFSRNTSKLGAVSVSS